MEQQKGLVHSRTYLEAELAQQRELEALIPARQVAVKNLPVAHIKPNPFQVRRRFHELDKLAEAIREHGLDTCLLWVRPDPDHPDYFQLIFGERWLHAARNAGLQVVPCEIAPYSDDELFEIGILENIRQRDLDALEEAFVFRNLVEQRGYTIDQLALRIGKDERHVIGRLALLAPVENRRQPASQRPTYRPPAPDRPVPFYEHGAGEHTRRFDNGNAAPGRYDQSDLPLHARVHHETPASTGSAGTAEPERSSPDTAQNVPSLRSVRRTVERDMGTLRAILARWQGLIDQGAAEHSIVADYWSELITEIERLNAYIHPASDDNSHD